MIVPVSRMALLIALVFFFCYPAKAQIKFLGTLSFVREKDSILIDSFNLNINEKYIEKKNTFTKGSFPFDQIVFIKDSNKIFHINNVLKKILSQDVHEKPFDTSSYENTNIEQVIMGYSCRLLTRFNQENLYEIGNQKTYSSKWVTSDMVAEYGNTFYPLLESNFGIYKNGIELASTTLFESEKDTAKYKTRLWKISSGNDSHTFIILLHYEIKEYKRETILEIIRELAERKNPFLKMLND